MERIIDDPNERIWGMFCHLAALAWFIPAGNLIGPLIVYIIRKDQYSFVNDQGKEVLNFQITMTIFMIISAFLIVVFIGLLLMGIVAIYSIVYTIIGALKANDGVFYRYPICIRFIK